LIGELGTTKTTSAMTWSHFFYEGVSSGRGRREGEEGEKRKCARSLILFLLLLLFLLLFFFWTQRAINQFKLFHFVLSFPSFFLHSFFFQKKEEEVERKSFFPFLFWNNNKTTKKPSRF